MKRLVVEVLAVPAVFSMACEFLQLLRKHQVETHLVVFARGGDDPRLTVAQRRRLCFWRMSCIPSVIGASIASGSVFDGWNVNAFCVLMKVPASVAHGFAG